MAKQGGIVLLEVTAETPFLEIDEVRTLAVAGRERGYLTFEEISTALEEVELTKEQTAEFRAHLQDHGVEIVSAEERPPGLIEISGDGAEATQAKKPQLDLTVEPSLDSLRLYLRSIGRVNLLTAAEEIYLAKRIERGDMIAKRQMIEANPRPR